MDEQEPIKKIRAKGPDPTRANPLGQRPGRRLTDEVRPLPAEPALRVVEDKPPVAKPTAAPAPQEKPRRSFHEGKSIEYTIDEIMQPKTTADPNSIEHEWGKKSFKIPAGWLAVFCALALIIAAGTYRVIDKNRAAEERIVETHQTFVDQETDEAKELVQSIERTVRAYYAAKTIDEKLKYVRHPEQMRPRMELYYAKHPIEAEECEMVTKFQPVVSEKFLFWQVLAIKSQRKGELVLLEQISPTEALVDWDSLVDFQVMPWEQYAREKPFTALSYRLEVEESPRYVGEFVDEKTWVSYRLTKPAQETILYGYVRRNSPAHLAIQEALKSTSRVMILRLQASSAIKVANSVVIQEVVSHAPYRPTPPKSVND